MLDKIKQLMEIKQQANVIKRELEGLRIEANEVRGIRIVIDGAQHFQSLEIENGLLDAPNKNRLEADLLRSINAAVHKSQVLAAQKMKNMTGLDIPGL